MAAIYHNFLINASVNRVFDAISTPEGLNQWWTKNTSGKLGFGEVFYMFFEPDYHWSAVVSKYIPNKEFELSMQNSDDNWEGTKLGFILTESTNTTDVQFYHIDWKVENEHYKISNYCWAMYLRILKRFLEHNEVVPYNERLIV